MIQMDESLLDELVDILYQRIEEKFRKQINNTNVEFSAEGIVTSVASDNTSATIALPFSSIKNVPNLSGSNLSVGDKVKIFYNKHDMSGAYIGVKF